MAGVEHARQRLDMHVHTRHSFDCLTDPARLIEQLDLCGLDRVCITDHNEIGTALVLKARYPERVIVGEEVKTAEHVDIIGLYISSLIPRGTPALETCARIHEQGGIVYLPHPYAPGKGGGGRILETVAAEVDVIEGFNARLHDPALNERATAWGLAHDVPLGAGSDAHTLKELGRAWVNMPACADEPGAFVAALRDATIHGRASSRVVHIASTYAKLHKRIMPGARSVPGADRR